MSLFKNLLKNTKELTSFTSSYGGDMRGSHGSTDIKLFDGNRAIVKVSDAEYYAAEPVENEYLVDKKLLEDICDIFNKSGMKFWSEAAMHRVFVADGASHSYTFTFGTERISFSSQCYPRSYSKQLKKIDQVIEKYLDGAEKKV